MSDQNTQVTPHYVDRKWYVEVSFTLDKNFYYLHELLDIVSKTPDFEKLIDNKTKEVVYQKVFRAPEMGAFWNLWAYLELMKENVKVFNYRGKQIPSDEIRYYHPDLKAPKGGL